MYMKYREPLPINMNPQLTMKDDPDPVKQQQVRRANANQRGASEAGLKRVPVSLI
jgi:hypothetical protein